MDIKSSLQEISAAGMSDAEIGAAIGAPQSIVTRLRNGVHKTTSWERGQAIVALAERLRKASPAEPSRTRLSEDEKADLMRASRPWPEKGHGRDCKGTGRD